MVPLPLPLAVRGIFGGILFERNLNTFNWLGRAKVDSAWGDFSLHFDDRYNSSIILTESSLMGPQRLQTNTHNLTMLPEWTLTEDLTAQTKWSSLSYSDAKAVGLSSASFNTLDGGLNYVPSPGIVINPLVGYSWEKQGGFRDEGLSYDLSMFTKPWIILDSYQLSGTLRFSQEHVDPRLLEDHIARIGMQKRFFGTTRDSIEVLFTRNRREFYSQVNSATAVIDTNIESRRDDILGFANLLDYDITRTLLSSFFIGVSNRVLDKNIRYIGTGTQQTPQFGTQIGEFLLNTFVQASYRSPGGSSSFLTRLQYNERNETHTAKPLPGVDDAFYRTANESEKTKDNLTRRTVLTADAQFPLARTDIVKFSGSASILRYDTPHILNVEDRDEQLFTLGLTTSHELSQYVDLDLTLGASLGHIVYLSAERSANNNINRVLRFSPRVSYRPFAGFVTTNTFEVLANYTVYDFEEQAARIRSFSYRQFSWLDSTTVPVSKRIALDFLVYLRLYERGQLQWDEFTERTENAFTDETYAIQIRFVPDPSVTFAAGVRYFSQTRFVFENGEREFDTRLQSLGPTCLVHWNVNRYSLIGFSGWYEKRMQSDGADRTLPNMTLNVQFTF